MNIQLIALIYNGNNLAGFRVIDVDNTKDIKDIPYNVMESVVISNKATVGGIEYDSISKKLKGSNGTFERYPVVKNGRVVKNSIVILATIDELGYKISNAKGEAVNIPTQELIKLAKNVDIANGKLVTKDNKSFVSAINGTYINIDSTNSDLAKQQKKIENDREYAKQLQENVNKAESMPISQKKIEKNNKTILIDRKTDPRVPKMISGSHANPSRLKEVDPNTGMTVEQKFSYTIMAVREVRPFYASVLTLLKRVEASEADGIDTMAVSLDTMYFSSQFVLETTLPDLLFIVLHEISHIAMKHRVRENKREHDLWNAVCDYYINKNLADEFGLKNPGDVVQANSVAYGTPDTKYQIGLPTIGLFNNEVDIKNDTPEAMYDELYKSQNDNNQGQNGNQENQNDQSNGQGNSQGDSQGDSQGNNQNNQNNGQGGDQSNKEDNQSSQGSESESKNGESGNNQNAGNEGHGSNTDNNSEESGEAGQSSIGNNSNNSNSNKQQNKNEQSGQENSQGNQQNNSNNESSNTQNNGSQQANNSNQENNNSNSSVNEESTKGKSNQNAKQSELKNNSTGVNNSGSDSKGGSNNNGQSQYNANEQRKPGRLVGKEFRGQKIKNFQSDIVDTPETAGMSEEQVRQIQNTLLRQAVTIHKQQHSFGGDTPDFLERYVEAAIAPKINWRSILKKYLIKESQREYSFAHPDRRFLSRRNSDGSQQVFAGPFKSPNGNLDNIKICVDTSGSISPEDIGTALAQVKDLLKQYKATAELVYWDTRVRAVYPFKDVKELLDKKPMGGGGTDANCIFDYFLNNDDYKKRRKQQPSLILVFTDGCFGSIDKQFYNRYKNTIWIVDDKYNFEAPFGVKAPFKISDM